MGTWFHVIDPETGKISIENSRDLRNRYGKMDDASFKKFIKSEESVGRVQPLNYPEYNSDNPHHDTIVKNSESLVDPDRTIMDSLFGSDVSNREKVLKKYAEKNKLDDWTGGEGLVGFGKQVLRGQTPMQQSSKAIANDVFMGVPQLVEDYTGYNILNPVGVLGNAVSALVSDDESHTGEYNRNINRAVRDATTGKLRRAAEVGAGLLAPGPKVGALLKEIPFAGKAIEHILPKALSGLEKAGITQTERVASALRQAGGASEAEAATMAALRRMAGDGTEMSRLARLGDIGKTAATAGLVGAGYGAGSAAINNIGTGQKQDVWDAAKAGGALGTVGGTLIRSFPHTIEGGSRMAKKAISNFGKPAQSNVFDEAATKAATHAGYSAKARAEANIPQELDLGLPVEVTRFDPKNPLNPAAEAVTKKSMAQALENLSKRGSQDYGASVAEANKEFLATNPHFNKLTEAMQDVRNRYDAAKSKYMSEVAPANQQSWYPEALDHAKNASTQSTLMHPKAFDYHYAGKPVESDLSPQKSAKMVAQQTAPATVKKIIPPQDPGIAAPGKKWPQNASPLAMRKEWTPENWDANRPTVQEVPNPAKIQQPMTNKDALNEWAQHFGVAEPRAIDGAAREGHYNATAENQFPRMVQAKNEVKENARALQNPAANQLVDKKLLSNIAGIADSVVQDPKLVGPKAADIMGDAARKYEKYQTNVNPVLEQVGGSVEPRTAKTFEPNVVDFLQNSSDATLRHNKAYTPLDNAVNYLESQKPAGTFDADAATLRNMRDLQDKIASAQYASGRVDSASGGAMGRRPSFRVLDWPLSQLQKAASFAEREMMAARHPGGMKAANQELYNTAKTYMKGAPPQEKVIGKDPSKWSDAWAFINDHYLHPVPAAIKGAQTGNAIWGYKTIPEQIKAAQDSVDASMRGLLEQPDTTWEDVARTVSENGLDMDAPKMKVYLSELTKKIQGKPPAQPKVQRNAAPTVTPAPTPKAQSDGEMQDVESFWASANNEDRWNALREFYKTEADVPDEMVDIIIKHGTKKRSRAEVREILKKQLHR